MRIDYRTPAGTGSYILLADDASISTGDAISGYQPTLTRNAQQETLAFSTAGFVADSGNSTWRVCFTVERIHASPDAALLFLLQHALIFNTYRAGFDLKITVGGQIVYAPSSAIIQYTPEPHSDQSTRIRYEFVASSYTNIPP